MAALAIVFAGVRCPFVGEQVYKGIDDEGRLHFRVRCTNGVDYSVRIPGHGAPAVAECSTLELLKQVPCAKRS